MQQNQSDMRMEDSLKEINFLMKLEKTDRMTIDYTKLDGNTANDLRLAISKVLHKRYNEVTAVVSGVGEFVVHNSQK